ncbi:MAG: orotidine-5-phosphate decarboxylase [Glaciihabitans sp.]|nr:orotidine-5-phosphate decarboxylase [Glaciihabitans sp.]
MTTFGERLFSAFTSAGHLCVGIDPHPYLLDRWGLADSAEGVREFGLRVVDAAGGRAGIVKPQVAFFERHGSAGFAALEKVLGAARASGLVVIADVKRGDLGTSVEAYGQAWLTPGSPLEADAMTVSAYQGLGSLDEPWRLALASGKGLFVLAATSNPESYETQTAIVGRGIHAGLTVAASIVDGVVRSNAVATPSLLGSLGVVLGATVDLADFGIVPGTLAATPILAPGFGHQGAQLSDIRELYGAAAGNVLVSSSRGILDAGPEGVATAIATQVRDLAEVYAA